MPGPGGRPRGEPSTHFIKFTDPVDGKEKWKCEFCPNKIYTAYSVKNFRIHLTSTEQKCKIPASLKQLLLKRPYESSQTSTEPDGMQQLFADCSSSPSQPSPSPSAMSVASSSRNV